jgi:hypothetical protein
VPNHALLSCHPSIPVIVHNYILLTYFVSGQYILPDRTDVMGKEGIKPDFMLLSIIAGVPMKVSSSLLLLLPPSCSSS